MARAYNVVDADGPILEPLDLWDNYMDPLDLTGPGFTPDPFKVFAIKSRVHFRRGFDDSGFAKTILLVEPEQPFLGTVRVEALPLPERRHLQVLSVRRRQLS